MSTCISSHGEYDAHEGDPLTGDYLADRINRPEPEPAAITIHDDGRITFAKGVTAIDYGDTIRLDFQPGRPGYMLSGPEAEIIYRTPGQPTRRVPAVPVLRKALAAEGVPTVRRTREETAVPKPDACYMQTLPSGDTACIRESHTGRPCRHLPPFEPEET